MFKACLYWCEECKKVFEGEVTKKENIHTSNLSYNPLIDTCEAKKCPREHHLKNFEVKVKGVLIEYTNIKEKEKKKRSYELLQKL